MNHLAAAELFRCLDRELWLVTARAEGRRGGLIATTVSIASIVPEAPRVTVGIAKQHATWELIEASSAFTLQLLPRDRLEVVARFGLHSGREIDKFADGDWSDELAGGPLLAGASGWLDCRVEARLDTGDRTVYLAAVTNALAPPTGEPILTLQHLLAHCPRDWLPQLRARLAEDAARDRLAIAAWRSRPQR